MYLQDSLLESFSSSERINPIILGIILAGAFNVIFITYSVRSRSTYRVAKIGREKLKILRVRIDKLSLMND